MKNEPKGHFRVPVNRPGVTPKGDTPTSKPVDRHLFQTQVARAGARGLLLLSLCGVAAAQGDGPTKLRQFIDQQVGGIDKLKVPATDAAIPVPKQPDGTVNYRYQTTEAKRYLGKLLFHDPVRSARINKGNYGQNEPQPSDLPAGTAFGGTLSASDPNIQAIINAERQDTSCGSCHIGEAASKAGQLVNFASGGEGRGYTDRNGNFFPDCNLSISAPNGECGQLSAPLGSLNVAAQYDPAITSGFGVRPSDQEVALGVQHQVLPRVAVDFQFTRHWFGNFVASQDTTQPPSAYNSFCVTAPTTTVNGFTLPNAGQQICGFADLNPAFLTIAPFYLSLIHI